MPYLSANGINIYYETHGAELAPTILMLTGMGGQLTRWQKTLYQPLVEAGHRVLMFDYRDVGLSDKLDSAGVPDMGSILAAVRDGRAPVLAYTLDDLAADAIGLLDALDVRRAHVVGVSMGGMVAQLIAINYPSRTLSLTSIMSTTGDPALPPSTPEAMAVLTNRGPSPEADLDGFLANSVRSARILGSPAYPTDEAVLRERALTDFRRSFYRDGFARQYAAVMAAPDRSRKLGNLRIPVVVVHGEADPLVPVQAGEDTARKIPNATFRRIEGMGHDLPLQIHPRLASAILEAIDRSKSNDAAAH